MRCLFGVMCVLTLAVLPLSVSAQDGENVAATSQHKPEESTLSDEPVSDKGALSPRVRKRTLRQWDPDTYKLRLDSSGLSQSPRPAPRQKPDPRLRQYRQGVIVSSLFVGIGGALIGSGVVVLRKWQREECLGLSCDLIPPGGTFVLLSLGSVAALGGLIGAAISGSKLGARKRKLRELREGYHGLTRRAQWDLAQSRLVF